ncbi:MAG: hypothetical protein Q4C48_04940 [Lachnospiraceae bacterium]|nr:hypothetical protein [Lachnospiraceae bacterium]
MKTKRIRKIDVVCIVAAVCVVVILMILLRKGGPFDAQNQKTVTQVMFSWNGQDYQGGCGVEESSIGEYIGVGEDYRITACDLTWGQKIGADRYEPEVYHVAGDSSFLQVIVKNHQGRMVKAYAELSTEASWEYVGYLYDFAALAKKDALVKIVYEEKQIALSKDEQQLIINGVLSDVRRAELEGIRTYYNDDGSKVEVTIEAEGYCGMYFEAYLRDGVLLLQRTEFVLPEPIRKLLKEKCRWQGDIR